MKKPAALVREIEMNQAKLMLLQKQHSHIEQEISALAALTKAKMIQLVGTMVESLDLNQVPIHALVSKLSQLGEGLIYEEPGAESDIQVFVKYGRNASSVNRQVLVSAGLHWHGRDGGWVGRVTEAQLATLRQSFGDRVSASMGEDAGHPPGEPSAAPPDVVSADVAAIVPSVEDDEAQGERATHQVQPASRLVRPSFPFPPRRPAEP